SAASSMAGVGFRDRTPEAREKILSEVTAGIAKDHEVPAKVAQERLSKELVAILDYAAVTIPGWKELTKGHIKGTAFKAEYVHSPAAGLHVIANVICAARIAGLNPKVAIDAMAKIPWRRDALRDGKDENGEPIKVHQFFEGDLVITVFDTEKGAWVGTPG